MHFHKLVCFVLICFVQKINSRLVNSDKISTLIINNLQKSSPSILESCSFVLIGNDDDKQDQSKSLVQNLGQNRDFPCFNFDFKSKNISVKPIVAVVPPFQKHSSYCKFVIILLSSFKNNNNVSPYFNQIATKLSPVFNPVIHKDLDRFIFIFNSEHEMNEILAKEDYFPATIKYKIGLAFEKDENIVVKTVCFFCGVGGTPQILKLNDIRFLDYVQNFNGKMLKISIPAIKSRIDITNMEINNAKSGLWKILFEEYLMVKFNFTYQMFLASGKGGTGSMLNNGSWVGTVGDVFSGKADLGIVTTKSAARVKLVSFTDSFFDISYLNFVTKTGKKIYSPSALLESFTLITWITICLVTVLAFLIFFGIVEIMSVLSPSSSKWGLVQQVRFITASYLDQDCSHLPKLTPLRCFVAMWLFYSMVIGTVYRSKMVSLLAFPRIEEIPSTYKQLVNSDYSIGFLRKGDSAYNAIQASRDPVYVKLFKKMEIISGHGLDCLNRVLSSDYEQKFACICYSASLVYLKAKNLSDFETQQLSVGKETTYNTFMGLMFSDGGSIYRENFDRILSWTRPLHLTSIWDERDHYKNARLVKRAWWKEIGQWDKLKHYEKTDTTILNLKHIYGAFYVLFLGCLVSLVVFLGEILYNWYNSTSGIIYLK